MVVYIERSAVYNFPELPSLQYGKYRGDVIAVCSILNSRSSSYMILIFLFFLHFQVVPTKLEGMHLSILKTDIRKNLFTRRAISQWNDLSKEVDTKECLAL